MPIERFFTTPVTRLRATERAGRGSDVVADWAEPSELDMKVWIVQTDTEDVRDTNSGDRSAWRLSAPVDTDIVRGDRIRHGELVLSVAGRPRVAPHPEQGGHHLVCNLELVEG